MANTITYKDKTLVELQYLHTGDFFSHDNNTFIKVDCVDDDVVKVVDVEHHIIILLSMHTRVIPLDATILVQEANIR